MKGGGVATIKREEQKLPYSENREVDGSAVSREESRKEVEMKSNV